MARTETEKPRRNRLAAYNEKRRFDATPEPKGRIARGPKSHLYTIQKHDATRLHYDLRLELDGVLLSWAVTKGPSLDPSQKRLAVRTEDHPVEYADFEGRIPEGNYGAGTVLLWDKGSWEPLEDPRDGLKNGKLLFRLKGKRLEGRWALVRFRSKQKTKRENWLLIKEKDDHAERTGNVTEEHQTSVASGRKLPAIEKDRDAVWKSSGVESGEKKKATAKSKQQRKSFSRLPAFHKPALATLVDEVPNGDDWLFEVKFDGYRALASVSGDKVKIHSRSGLDWTHRFPGIADALAGLDLDGALLDGEIVAVDEKGKSDFSSLQQSLKSAGGGLSYFVFDLLRSGGDNLIKEPLTERKKRLKDLLADAPRKGPVFFVDDVANGTEMFEALCQRGWEGVIAKRRTSRYPSGRGRTWLKIKCSNEQEFVIVGWSPSDKDRPFASLLLGLHEDGKLIYAGRVGTGFSENEMEALAVRFKSLARKTPPVEGDIPSSVARNANWLTPELVAQVAFAEMTSAGIVRHGRYLGLREDKEAEDVTTEKAAAMPEEETSETKVAGVRLTHPDKVLFPQQGVTKRALAEYLAAASERMLVHCGGRLVSLVRCPDGRSKKCFFQRHAGAGLPDALKEVKVKSGSGGTEAYLEAGSHTALVSAAQMGVLEFHIWGSRTDDVEKPDRIVFDLDPSPDVDFGKVKKAAMEMRDALDALGLQSFPLLTGGKGIHVVVPIVRKYEWPVVKNFAAALAKKFADHDPDRFIATMSKAKRKGRIFIDYLRNERSATAICPYSPRSREGAPVAWPVTWDELEKAKAANGISIAEAMKRLDGPDPWADYGRTRQGLKKSALDALDIEPD